MKLNRGVLALVAMIGVMAATGCKKSEDPGPPAGDPAQSGAPGPSDPAQAGAPGTDDPTAQGAGNDDRGPRRARKHRGRHGGRRHWQKRGGDRQWGGDPANESADPGAPPQQQ